MLKVNSFIYFHIWLTYDIWHQAYRLLSFMFISIASSRSNRNGISYYVRHSLGKSSLRYFIKSSSSNSKSSFSLIVMNLIKRTKTTDSPSTRNASNILEAISGWQSYKFAMNMVMMIFVKNGAKSTSASHRRCA